jgi:hypothetical protein
MGTDLNAGLTADTFVSVHRFRLAINQLIDRYRTGVDALFTSLALIFINNDFPHGKAPFLRFDKKTDPPQQVMR